MQNSGFGGFSNANAFSLPPDQAQARNALPNVSSSQTNNTRSSSAVDRLASPNGIGFGGMICASTLQPHLCKTCSQKTQLLQVDVLQ